MADRDAARPPAGFGPASAASPQSLGAFIRASGLNSIVLGASKDPNAKVTILLVSPEDGRPVYAVKVPTTGAAARAVEAERAVLATVTDGLPPALAATVPRVLGTVAFRGRDALVMTALQGTPMTASYFRWRHTARRSQAAADFAAVAAWLSSLQEATAGERAPIDVSDLADRLLDRFRDDARVVADVERLSEIGVRLRAETTPRTAVHGDFWFGNVLLDGGRASGIVDWEFGLLAADPTRDLARFALMYALYLDRRTKRGRRPAGHPGLRAGTWGAGVEFAVNGSGWFPELFRAFLGAGLARLDTSPARWRDVTLAGIAEIAAVTDHDTFAQHHLELFRRLAAGSQSRPPRVETRKRPSHSDGPSEPS